MNIVEKIARRLIPKAFDPLENIDLTNVIGWKSVGGSTSFGYYRDNQYENGYSSISKLANGFAAVEPYTIDKNGKAVPSNILDRLYTPNTDMSAVDFREALAVTTLVHDKVRLRVHHKGNSTKFNADSITGFTFMEGYTEQVAGGERTYLMPNGDVLKDNEVITLKNINPYNVTDGFSVSKAAQRWTKLDDYLADYQKGFFENGAVPAGQFIITARTTSEFNDIVDKLEARHKGASKNNNVTYTHRPTDANGSPLNSQIEWIPFATANKDMALKDLFENINKKIDSVYGVPSEIRGFLSNSNYASVGIAEKVFVKYALYPMTLKIWSKFTHELNRITGGMGVAIDFDLDIPEPADEELVKAQAKGQDATTVATLVTQGFELESAVEYIKTGDVSVLVVGVVTNDDEPDVLTADEARGTPEQPIDVYAKRMKLLELKHEILAAEVAKKPKKAVAKKKLQDIDKALYEYKLAGIIREQMSRQVDKAVSQLDSFLAKKAIGDTDSEEDAEFTSAMLGLLVPLITQYGNRTTVQGTGLIVQAGLSTENIKPFELTPAQKKAYQKYLTKIGTGYADQTAVQIRDVISSGIFDGLTKSEIEDNLRSVITGAENEFRVQRLARTEVNLSEGRASVAAMDNIMDQTGYSIYKEWHTSSTNPCPFCEELDGTETLVSESFLGVGDTVETRGGEVFVNNWTDIESASLHANCNCYTTYRVERD